jgi:hypothetical protein
LGGDQQPGLAHLHQSRRRGAAVSSHQLQAAGCCGG